MNTNRIVSLSLAAVFLLGIGGQTWANEEFPQDTPSDPTATDDGAGFEDEEMPYRLFDIGFCTQASMALGVLPYGIGTIATWFADETQLIAAACDLGCKYKGASSGKCEQSTGPIYDHSGLVCVCHNASDPVAPTVAPPLADPCPEFPGTPYFRDGQKNKHVLKLAFQLVRKGCSLHKTPISDTWGSGDRNSVRAFQVLQGWTGSGADGYPGPETWRRLFCTDAGC